MRSTQLEQERLEKELRNKEAQALEAEITKQKRKEKENILDELVSIIHIIDHTFTDSLCSASII